LSKRIDALIRVINSDAAREKRPPKVFWWLIDRTWRRVARAWLQGSNGRCLILSPFSPPPSYCVFPFPFLFVIASPSLESCYGASSRLRRVETSLYSPDNRPDTGAGRRRYPAAGSVNELHHDQRRHGLLQGLGPRDAETIVFHHGWRSSWLLFILFCVFLYFF
jgi:hypothetical protein